MSKPATVWRPPQLIRAIAIGILRRGDELCLMAVRNDDGSIDGWRPPGGTIEFGERAADTLRREIMEELGEPIKVGRQLLVTENLYDHQGVLGHEIAFIFEAAFTRPGAELRERYAFTDGGVDNLVTWVPIADFTSGKAKLFPEELLEFISASSSSRR